MWKVNIKIYAVELLGARHNLTFLREATLYFIING